MLFSDKGRTETDPAKPGELQYWYLERSGRPEAGRIRALLEEWFAAFPEQHREELRRRLQASDDVTFLAAFSELYFHALLRALGYEVEVHPVAPSGAEKRPDFLVSDAGAVRFYLEVTLATDASEEESAAQARADRVFSTLGELESPNFFLLADVRGAPATPPPGRRLRSRLEKWLRTLDPDQTSAEIAERGTEACPTLPFEHDGWRIEFSAVPKSPEKRGRPEVRPIGGEMYGAKLVRPEKSVRNKVEKKATRYDDLSAPYVIAVNLDTPFGDDDSFLDALLGTSAVQLSPGGAATNVRVPDGVWHGETGPKNTRVSAVLGITSLRPWMIGSSGATVYHNPWAGRPLEQGLIPLSRYEDVEGQYVFCEGALPRSILGLGEGWPRSGR